MIEVRHLKKSFGEQVVLKDVSFSADNETVGLLGANGSGKTTLLRCLLGILDYQGEVIIDGHDVRKDPLAVRRLIGYIPQTFPSSGELTLEENISFFARLRGVGQDRKNEVLEQFNLSSHKRKRIGQLSGGLRQKFSIAVALLSDPKVIFLDEPTANLDTWAIRDVLDILKLFRNQKTVILSSHRIEEVLAVSHRLVQLEGGVLVEPNPDDLRLERPESLQ